MVSCATLAINWQNKLHISPRFLLQVSLGKTLVLVLNKIDLVDPELSAAWKAYLQVVAAKTKYQISISKTLTNIL